MNKIKLSIVICTYNRSKLLNEALESALNQQTSFPFEVIVSDDCSTDDTQEMLVKKKEKYQDKLIINRLSKNSGLGANWASAVLLARGTYVASLDDDDYWTDNHRMQIMVDYLESHPDIGVLYTNGYYLDEKTGKKKLIVYPKNDFPNIHELWKGNQPCIQFNMVMIRKACIDECIKLEDYIKYGFPIQDWNTIILLLKKTRFAYLDLPTSILRLTEGSMSRPKEYDYIIRKYEKEWQMYVYLSEQFPEDPLINYDEEEKGQYMNHILASIAFDRGDYQKAKYYTRLSKRHTFRDRCTCSWLTFQLYRLARIIRRKKTF